jgi:hypothetical protein
MTSFVIYPPDATQEEVLEAQRNQQEHNQRVVEDLVKKGLKSSSQSRRSRPSVAACLRAAKGCR